MDVFIEKLPADAVEVEVNCCSLHMSRNGRRFEARIKGSVYLRNKTVSLAVVKVYDQSICSVSLFSSYFSSDEQNGSQS